MIFTVTPSTGLETRDKGLRGSLVEWQTGFDAAIEPCFPKE